MEKQGVIKEGVTPPEEDKPEDKQASDRPKTTKEREAELEQDPIRRLADKVE